MIALLFYVLMEGLLAGDPPFERGGSLRLTLFQDRLAVAGDLGQFGEDVRADRIR